MIDTNAFRPRLEPYVTVVPDGAETCHLMVGERVLLQCRGRLAPLLATTVFSLLDGTSTVEQLCDRLEDRLPRPAVLSLLSTLARERVVFDDARAPLPPEAETRFAGLRHLLGRFAPDPFQSLRRLLASRVAVVGDSPLVREIGRALAASAIGQIELVVDRPIEPLPEQPPIQIRASGFNQLEAALSRCDLAIGVQDGDFGALPLLRRINRRSVEDGGCWLPVRLTLDGEGWLGPLCLEDEACFECLRLRLKNNLETWRESSLHELGIQRGELSSRRLDHQPLQDQLASMVASETVRFLVDRAPPRLASRVVLVDLLTQESRLETVLKHPLCPVCSRARELRIYPWSRDDLRFERMLQ